MQRVIKSTNSDMTTEVRSHVNIAVFKIMQTITFNSQILRVKENTWGSKFKVKGNTNNNYSEKQV